MAKKKIDAATALAEQLAGLLEAQQRRGGEHYPPTLRRLGELCDGSPEPDLIVKAAAKKAFTDRGVVTEKVDRKPSLDSPVYIKGDERAKPTSKPKRAPTAKKPDAKVLAGELAARMLLVLEAQRRLGEGAYPPTLRRLAELCDHNASDTLVPKAASDAAMAERAVVVGKPVLDGLVVLREDIEQRLPSVLPALLRFALRPAPVTGKGKKGETHAFTLAEVEKKFDAKWHHAINSAVSGAIERDGLP